MSWIPRRQKSGEPVEIRVRPSLTHEEMAQMIGASRETVTRLIGDLKRKEFIRLEGSTLVIQNRRRSKRWQIRRCCILPPRIRPDTSSSGRFFSK